MTTIPEGILCFTFPAPWLAEKFDQLPFYRKEVNGLAHSKAVDIVAVAPRGQGLWLIEVKDYRQHPRTKATDLFEEVAAKVRDSLAGLACMAWRANASNERALAKAALQAKTLRVVLHLEQPRSQSKLFPWVIDPKTAQDQLRRALRAADPHPLVGDRDLLANRVPWTVQ